MESKEALKRDWTSLPPEVLNIIAKRLGEISDFVRFRAVCPAWSSSTAITDFIPQFPWIFVRWRSEDKIGLTFHSIQTDKLYTVRSPKFENKDLHIAVEGYLAALPISQNSILNPLSGHEITLPTFDVNYRPVFFMPWLGKSAVCCFVCGPESERNLFFYHDGQENWHRLKFDPYDYPVYLNDKLFTVHGTTGATEVRDIATQSLAYVIPPVDDAVKGSVYLMEASGDILRLSRHKAKFPPPYKHSCDIHRLDVNENGSRGWVKVKNIGNRAFFADGDTGFVLEANELAGIKANVIYFLVETLLSNGRWVCQLETIDIENGSTDHIPLPFDTYISWFVPNLRRL